MRANSIPISRACPQAIQMVGSGRAASPSLEIGSNVRPASYLLAASGPQSAAYCWNQMQIDMLYCASLRPSAIVAACRAQAMERYAACLTGKRMPPLPF